MSYEPGTVAAKLAAVRRLHEVIVWRGLRVSEVARPIYDDHGRKRTRLEVADIDLDAGTIKVTGKGRKTRTVYLTETSAAVLRVWLDVRESLADAASQPCSYH